MPQFVASHVPVDAWVATLRTDEVRPVQDGVGADV